MEEEQDNPIVALNKLVTYFEIKLSINGKKYDRSAIKFYLVNEMIKCRVFPNEGVSMMLASSNTLKSSAMYIGYLILKEIQKQNSIF